MQSRNEVCCNNSQWKLHHTKTCFLWNKKSFGTGSNGAENKQRRQSHDQGLGGVQWNLQQIWKKQIRSVKIWLEPKTNWTIHEMIGAKKTMAQMTKWLHAASAQWPRQLPLSNSLLVCVGWWRWWEQRREWHTRRCNHSMLLQWSRPLPLSHSFWSYMGGWRWWEQRREQNRRQRFHCQKEVTNSLI